MGILILLQAENGWASPHSGVFRAVGAYDSQEATRLLIIVVTIFGALLIGLLLYHLSQRSSQSRFKQDTSARARKPSGSEADSKAIVLPVILDQLKGLPVSPQQSQRIARTVSDIVAQTLQEQMDTAKNRLDEQYNQLFEQQRRTETVLQHKYRETLIEKKQAVAVLESIAEGLVVVNNKGEVVMMNPAAAKLLAVKEADRMGKPLMEHLKEDQLIALVKSSSGDDREIVVNTTQDRTKRILRASNAVVSDEDGTAIGMVSVLSDVTKQRELEELKSEFVSKVSHELRTPIIAMRHALSILVDQVVGSLSTEQQKFTDVLQRNLNRLNTLIDDLLDLSKLEVGKMELRPELGSIQQVVQTVCDSLEPWAQSKALTLNKRLPADLPLVTFDQDRITQVLTNLIGNAVKFTPKQGKVIVEAKHDSERQLIVVSVIDNGIGIAKEDLPKLFHKFQQLGERTASDISGTGLGLAIAKEIVELHHGRIWAESELNQSTRFSFTLPLTPQSSSQP